MKPHPHCSTLDKLTSDARELRHKIPVMHEADMRTQIGRIVDQHIALLAVVSSMASDLYPVGVPDKPGDL